MPGESAHAQERLRVYAAKKEPPLRAGGSDRPLQDHCRKPLVGARRRTVSISATKAVSQAAFMRASP